MKTLRSKLFPLFAVVFIDNFAFAMLFNMLGPLLLLPEYGMIPVSASVYSKNTILALTYMAFPFAQFIAAPWIGAYGDVYGRKKALSVSLTGITAGFLLSAFALFFKSVWFLLVSRLITGLFAGNISICLAAVADLCKDEKSRGKNFSMITAMYGKGWITAMVLGGFIANPKLFGTYAPMIAFMCAALFTCVGFIIVLQFFRENSSSKGKKLHLAEGMIDIKNTLLLKPSRTFFAVFFFWAFSWIAVIQWYPVLSMDWFGMSSYRLTLWFLALGVSWVLGSFISRYVLIKLFKPIYISIYSFLALSLVFLTMEFVNTFYAFSILFVLAALFAVIAMTSAINVISFSAEERMQGKAMGLVQSAQSVAYITVSMTIFFAGVFSELLFPLASVLAFVGAAFLFRRAI